MASLLSSFVGTSVRPVYSLAECPLKTKSSRAVPDVATPSQLQVLAVKKIQGTVKKTVNDKTASVEVKRIYPHPLYKKRITSIKVYQAHDPENKCKPGDVVTLAKCAPVSKSKKFLVVDIQPPRVAGSRAAAARAEAEAESAENKEELPPLESNVAEK